VKESHYALVFNVIMKFQNGVKDLSPQEPVVQFAVRQLSQLLQNLFLVKAVLNLLIKASLQSVYCFKHVILRLCFTILCIFKFAYIKYFFHLGSQITSLYSMRQVDKLMRYSDVPYLTTKEIAES